MREHIECSPTEKEHAATRCHPRTRRFLSGFFASLENDGERKRRREGSRVAQMLLCNVNGASRTSTPTTAPRCHLERSRPRFRVGVRLALFRRVILSVGHSPQPNPKGRCKASGSTAKKFDKLRMTRAARYDPRRATAYALGSRGAQMLHFTTREGIKQLIM